ncbi:MAG: hypothetical protein DRI79_10060 [Chloroflexi bacterium]|nr:MAG: hypothetical protein DRI79_10060 [Chloroflexota bacterium]
MTELGVKRKRAKRWLTHWGISTLMGLAFGLAVGYYLSTYYVGYFSVETCLWATAFSLLTLYSIGVLCAVSEALLRPRLKGLSRTKRLWFEVPTSVAAHVVGFLIPTFLFYWLLGFPMRSFLTSLGGFLVVFVIIHEFEYLVRFYRELKEAEIREERLRTLAAQSELKALKAQINPHFLFNTLNTIAGLIGSDPQKAEEITERLAEVFRYVLVASEREFVALGEELRFIEAYLSIEKARFGERLQVERDVSPSVLETPVPALILQPLVENALRHGQGTDGSVDLSIRAQPQDGEVLITIADRGPGLSVGVWGGESRGHGLHNVDERLRRTYGEEYGVEIGCNEPQGTVVAVRLPVGSV